LLIPLLWLLMAVNGVLISFGNPVLSIRIGNDNLLV
jgi:hypothetical protein